MFTKRRLIIAGAIFISLPLLLLVFLVEEHYRGKKWLKTARAELMEKGEKLTIAELKPSSVPDDDNGMLLMPFGRIQRGPEAATRRFVAPGTAIVLSKLDQGFLPLSTNLRRPTPWSVLDNWHLSEATNLAAILSALEKPRLAAKVPWENGFNGRWDHFTDLKKCGLVLSKAALNDLHSGRYPEAHRLVLAGASIDRALKHEPLLISQLVRMAQRNISTALLWEALHHNGWTEAQLADWQQAFQRPDFAAGMAKAMDMERAMSLHMLELLRGADQNMMDVLNGDDLVMAGNLPSVSSGTGSLEWSDVLDYLGITKAMQIGGEYIVSPAWKFAFLDQAQAYHIDAYQGLIESMRHQAEVHRFDTNWSANFEATIQKSSVYDRMRFTLTWMSLPAMDRAMLKALKADTLNEIAVTAIALERHRSKYQRYPETLEMLIPDLLTKTPIDFMTGGQLRYRLELDGRFTLWSVGENQIDDDGDPRPVSPQGSFNDTLYGRDFVWPKSATTDEVTRYLSSTNTPAQP